MDKLRVTWKIEKSVPPRETPGRGGSSYWLTIEPHDRWGSPRGEDSFQIEVDEETFSKTKIGSLFSFTISD